MQVNSTEAFEYLAKIVSGEDHNDSYKQQIELTLQASDMNFITEFVRAASEFIVSEENNALQKNNVLQVKDFILNATYLILIS